MPSPPLLLSEIPSLSLLYKLRRLAPASETSSHKANKKFNDIVSLIRHDITALEVSAIVNAANRSLLGGGGVDGAIHARAGPALLEECETLDGCQTGSAKITDGYELPCDKVIHAVGPIYATEKRKDSSRPGKLLKGCYKTSLELAVENGCKSIAFSCIGTGVYGYPPEKAAREVISFVRQWLEEMEEDGSGGIERIVFCCFEKKDLGAYEGILPEYFPPVEDHVETSEEDGKRAETLEKALPDPPSGEPTSPGEPVPKKPKISQDEDDDWEQIDKQEESAVNGIPDDEGKTENQSVDTGSKETAAAIQTTEESKPTHGLLKDW